MMMHQVVDTSTHIPEVDEIVALRVTVRSLCGLSGEISTSISGRDVSCVQVDVRLRHRARR